LVFGNVIPIWVENDTMKKKTLSLPPPLPHMTLQHLFLLPVPALRPSLFLNSAFNKRHRKERTERVFTVFAAAAVFRSLPSPSMRTTPFPFFSRPLSLPFGYGVG
jgi:hypothetical protein